MTDPLKTKIDLISAHGGYPEQKSFQQAELVYDLLDYEDFLRQRGLTCGGTMILWRDRFVNWPTKRIGPI